MGTDFLYAKPNFWGGVATSVDLMGILVSEYNRSATPNIADYHALLSDWVVTGKDIEIAIEKFKTVNNVEKK